MPLLSCPSSVKHNRESPLPLFSSEKVRAQKKKKTFNRLGSESQTPEKQQQRLNTPKMAHVKWTN